MIDYGEFKKGVADYGLDLSKDECKKLFEEFDNDGSGSVDFDEFLIDLRPPMSKARTAVIMEAFRKLDKSGDGIVTVEDLKGVYDVRNHKKYKSGEWTEDQCLTEFINSFEGGKDVPACQKDGKITKEEFINYYAGVSASIDTDAYFILMMRNAW